MRDDRIVAAFDFDGTLTTTDSLCDFVRLAIGNARFAAGVLRAAPWLACTPGGERWRDAAKAHFLAATIGGMAQGELERLAQDFATQALPAALRPDMAARIEAHRRRGHRLVLVSASPAIYLRPWGARAGFDAVLATELEFAGGSFSGRLAAPNCWGPEKAKRLLQWFGGVRPDVLYAYGDTRGDREMLALSDHGWLRGNGALPHLPD